MDFNRDLNSSDFLQDVEGEFSYRIGSSVAVTDMVAVTTRYR